MAKTQTVINTTASTPAPPPLLNPRAYRDTAFKSRTLVMDDGRAFLVEQSRIVTDLPELVAYLDQHADFEDAEA